MKVKSLTNSNMIFNGTTYLMDKEQMLNLPDDDKELSAYIKANKNLFEIQKAPAKKSTKKSS